MDLRTILVIAEGQLGDLLLLTPALRAVKSTYPQAVLSVLALERRPLDVDSPTSGAGIVGPLERTANHPLATNSAVDRLYLLNRAALRSRRGIQRAKAEVDVVRFLRRQAFDAVLCTFPQDRFVLWAFLSGAGIRVGQKRQGLSWLLTLRPDMTKDRLGVLHYYLGLAGALGATAASKYTDYAIPDSSRAWADGFLRANMLTAGHQLIAVHPGASGDYKVWPPQSYAALIDRLQSAEGMKVLLCHGDLDASILEAIRTHLRTSVVEVRTADHMGHLAALLSRCALCVSNDSGPRHLAVAVGAPSLALFRNHHDREWGVYEQSGVCVVVKGEGHCPVCPAGECRDVIPAGERFGACCIRTISVDRVVLEIRRMLRRA